MNKEEIDKHYTTIINPSFTFPPVFRPPCHNPHRHPSHGQAPRFQAVYLLPLAFSQHHVRVNSNVSRPEENRPPFANYVPLEVAICVQPGEEGTAVLPSGD